MRRLTAVIVTAALIFFVIFSGTPTVRPVEAASDPDVIAAAMVVLVIEVGVLIATQTGINEARSAILDATKSMQDRAIIEQRFDTTMYAHDHRALSDDNKIDPSEVTLSVEFSGATDLSFTSTPADFPGDYKKRAETLGQYAGGVTNYYDSDLKRIAMYQAEALEPMVEALFAGDEKDDLRDIWEDEYDEMLAYHDYLLPYSTARPDNFKDNDDNEDFLDDEILTGPGYRRTIQASAQVSNLKNHLMASVRAGLVRQADADVKYAHNEQQERAETHFAFERAVGQWNLSSGTDY